MPKLFNFQNCLKRRSQNVYLNITSSNCDFEFITFDEDSRETSPATPQDFLRTKNKLLNYPYKGGFHICNYELNTKIVDNTRILVFSLNRVTGNNPYKGIVSLYDYANAIFKNGSPVYNITLTFDLSGNLINSKFTSLLDNANNLELEYRIITCDTNYDDTTSPGNVEKPNIYRVDDLSEIQNWKNTLDNQIVSLGIKRDIYPSTMKKYEALAWFIYCDYEYIIFNMVISSDSAFNINGGVVGNSKRYSYYSDDQTADEVDRVESYINKTFVE